MKIFIEGKDFNRRAYFGWQDQDTALIGIKMGYKNSADDLVDIALREGEKSNIRILDTYIFPIVFLYRNSIEASLKSIYFRFCGEILKGGHDLVVLWDNLNKQVLLEFEKDTFIEQVKSYKKEYRQHKIEGKDKQNIRRLLAEFNNLKDTNADVFRYLIDKKGELYFAESKFVDYDNLKETMEYIYGFLDFLYFITDDYLSS